MRNIAELARIVDGAALHARAIGQLSASGELSLADAYAVQRASIELRVARGERIVGVKMGFTSRAKAVQMGVHDLIYGKLTDAMALADGDSLQLDRFIHPRVEPELAMRLGRPLCGRVGVAEAYAAVDAVAPAIEIIDSRYENFRFSLADVVADNSSASAFVVGPWRPKPEDPANLGLILAANGQPVQAGSTASVLGNPARALAAAARLLGAAGERLEAGWIVLTGGATAAEPLHAGAHIGAEFEGLGRAGFYAHGEARAALTT